MDSPPKETAFPGHAPRVASEFRASLLQLPLDDDESLFLLVQSIHPTLGATVTFAWRFWSDRERQIKNSSRDLPVSANGTTAMRAPMERGALLTMRVQETTSPELPLGNLWARAILIKGTTGAILGTGLVAQGYVSQTNELAWPGSPIQTLLSGKGVIRQIAWTQPGATVCRVTVPLNKRWRVITGVAFLVADATAGGRGVLIQVYNGTADMFFSETGLLQPPSTTVRYSLAGGIAREAGVPALAALVPWLEDLELRAGDTIDMALTGPGGPADTLTGDQLLVREWFDP